MTPTKPTLREMSDFLATNLLGWQKDYAAWFDGDKDVVSIGAWQPHEDIAQCFEYLIHAMFNKGWRVSINQRNNKRGALRTWRKHPGEWDVTFWQGGMATAETTYGALSPADNPAAAIVEASYLAIVQET